MDDVHEFLNLGRINAVTRLEASADDNAVSVFEVGQDIFRFDAGTNDDREVTDFISHRFDIFNGDSLVLIVLGDDDGM